MIYIGNFRVNKGLTRAYLLSLCVMFTLSGTNGHNFGKSTMAHAQISIFDAEKFDMSFLAPGVYKQRAIDMLSKMT